MYRSDSVFLLHIMDEINFVLEASKETHLEDFLKNPTLTRAFARSFEIIGEAVKQLSGNLTIQFQRVTGGII